MKKFLTLIAFLATISLTAQGQIKFGVKGGLNLSKLSLDKKVVTSDNQMGFFIGPSIKFVVPIVGIGFDAAALYDERAGELEYGETSTKLKQQSIQIPVNLRWGFGIGKVVNIYFYAGPQFGFNVGSKDVTFMDNGVKWEFKKSHITGNAGLGILLLNHLQISGNYNMAFGKTGDFVVLNEYGEKFGYNGNKSGAKMNTWQVALTYYF